MAEDPNEEDTATGQPVATPEPAPPGAGHNLPGTPDEREQSDDDEDDDAADEKPKRSRR